TKLICVPPHNPIRLHCTLAAVVDRCLRGKLEFLLLLIATSPEPDCYRVEAASNQGRDLRCAQAGSVGRSHRPAKNGSTDAANRSATCTAPGMNCFSEGRELTKLAASAVLEARTAITIAVRYSVLMAMVPFVGPSPQTN